MIRIRYTGPKVPKTVATPVPLIFNSERTGEVVCDPIGEFSDVDGHALLALGGYFERADPLPEVSPGKPKFVPNFVPALGEDEEFIDPPGSLMSTLVYGRIGVAVMNRNRSFPGCEVVKQENGTYRIQKRVMKKLAPSVEPIIPGVETEGGHLALEAKAEEVQWH